MLDSLHLYLMKFFYLINESKKRLETDSIDYQEPIGFEKGALWMAKKLKIDSKIDSTDFVKIGLIKYGISLLSCTVPFFIFSTSSVKFWLSAIVLFYIVEIHFLFIYPLSIERRHPIWINSIMLTYRVGIIKCFVNTIVLGIFMTVGLIKFNKPFYNWYVGCYSIIVWYEQVRNRL